MRWPRGAGSRRRVITLVCLAIALAVGVAASLAGAPAPSFAEPRDYATRSEPDSVVIGDLNGDRKPDLASANGNAVSVLVNTGNGNFQAKVDFRVQAKLQYRASGAESLAIGDLNGDGRLDLATSNLDDNTIAVLMNTPGLCVVQDVRRMTLPVATRTLARVNCRVGDIGSEYSDAFKRGLVMRQKPAAGAVEPDGDEVHLVVSLGPKS